MHSDHIRSGQTLNDWVSVKLEKKRKINTMYINRHVFLSQSDYKFLGKGFALPHTAVSHDLMLPHIKMSAVRCAGFSFRKRDNWIRNQYWLISLQN